MLNLKATPSGVDIVIQDYQKWIYPKIKTLWGISDDAAFESYGRVYRNNTDKGYVPEVFVENSGTTYKEVLFDQTNHSVLSFFQVEPKREYSEGSMKVRVNLYFIINDKRIKKEIWRASEEIKQDLFQLAHANNYGMMLLGSESGFKQIFKDYDGWISKDTVSFLDLEPFYCIKLNYSVAYNIFDN